MPTFQAMLVEAEHLLHIEHARVAALAVKYDIRMGTPVHDAITYGGTPQNLSAFIREAFLPEAWRDTFVAAWFVPGHGLCVVASFIYTKGLLTNVTFRGEHVYEYKRRYCYDSRKDAVAAMLAWDGKDDPPGEWIKEKVSGRKRVGGDL